MAAVLNSHGVIGKDNLTRRYGALLSNANLMLRMDEILPQHILKLLPPPSTRSLQVHDCGTVVEACAKFVYDAGDSRGLLQLAEYLYAADARDAAPHLGERPLDADGASRVARGQPQGQAARGRAKRYLVLQLDPRHVHPSGPHQS